MGADHSHGRYVTFQMARGRGVATDVVRYPVSDRAAAGAARASVRCGKRLDWQTTEEVRSDESRAECFGAWAQTNWRFRPPSRGRFRLAEDARRGNHELTTVEHRGNCGLS